MSLQLDLAPLDIPLRMQHMWPFNPLSQGSRDIVLSAFLLPVSPAYLQASLLLFANSVEMKSCPGLNPLSTHPLGSDRRFWGDLLTSASPTACPFISLPKQGIQDLHDGGQNFTYSLPTSAGMRKQFTNFQTRAAPTPWLGHLFAFEVRDFLLPSTTHFHFL